MEVFVQPFPGPGAKVRISTEGGVSPAWSRTGRELLFLGADNRVMAAKYSTAGTIFQCAEGAEGERLVAREHARRSPVYTLRCPPGRQAAHRSRQTRKR